MTITCIRALTSLLVPTILSLGACIDRQDSSGTQASASRTSVAATDLDVSLMAELKSAVATITNMLPGDGCSYPVKIEGVDYAPDASSLAAIRGLVPPAKTITALISYRLTGNTGQVQCGWGTIRQLPEISFRVLRVIDDAG